MKVRVIDSKGREGRIHEMVFDKRIQDWRRKCASPFVYSSEILVRDDVPTTCQKCLAPFARSPNYDFS